MKINEVIVKEQATAGATSAGNIATLSNPHVAAGPDRFKKSYTGSPGRIRNESTQRAKTQDAEANRQRINNAGHQPVRWTSSDQGTCTNGTFDPDRCGEM